LDLEAADAPASEVERSTNGDWSDASKSPVPFKMWSTFVRRRGSFPYFFGSNNRLGNPEFQQTVHASNPYWMTRPDAPAWEKVISPLRTGYGNPFSKCGGCRLGEGASDRRLYERL
jgi:hypothetical protein